MQGTRGDLVCAYRKVIREMKRFDFYLADYAAKIDYYENLGTQKRRVSDVCNVSSVLGVIGRKRYALKSAVLLNSLLWL